MESKFKVGQVWKNRGGDEVTIDVVCGSDALNYPVLDTKGDLYTSEGKYHSEGKESVFDLVELVSDRQPSAPAIADAMLADAVALAPQHDAEAAAEPLPALDLALDPGAGTVRQLASEEERALFDALIIRAVDNSGIDHTVHQLAQIRSIIEARRAL